LLLFFYYYYCCCLVVKLVRCCRELRMKHRKHRKGGKCNGDPTRMSGEPLALPSAHFSRHRPLLMEGKSVRLWITIMAQKPYNSSTASSIMYSYNNLQTYIIDWSTLVSPCFHLILAGGTDPPLHPLLLLLLLKAKNRYSKPLNVT